MKICKVSKVVTKFCELPILRSCDVWSVTIKFISQNFTISIENQFTPSHRDNISLAVVAIVAAVAAMTAVAAAVAVVAVAMAALAVATAVACCGLASGASVPVRYTS